MYVHMYKRIEINKLIYSIKSGVLFASFSCSATLQEKEVTTSCFGTQINFVSDSFKKIYFPKEKGKKESR